MYYNFKNKSIYSTKFSKNNNFITINDKKLLRGYIS